MLRLSSDQMCVRTIADILLVLGVVATLVIEVDGVRDERRQSDDGSCFEKRHCACARAEVNNSIIITR
jgi:hypothetical protein